jgi:hypothetical protein
MFLHEFTTLLQSHYKVTVHNYLNTSWGCDKNFHQTFVFIILQICQYGEMKEVGWGDKIL